MIHWLDSRPDAFPRVETALREPDGLLAAGGDLSSERLLAAYTRGIFPWYEDGQPILWWSPDPRAVLFLDEFHMSRSLRRTLRRGRYRVTLDRAFPEVVAGCAAPRRSGDGTWITEEMMSAYTRLHALGWGHSVEVWQDERLVGGLYGLAIDKVFFGESMFSRASDASKVAVAALVDRLAGWGYVLMDCQLMSPHLQRLGCRPLPRSEFVALVARHARISEPHGSWATVGVDLQLLGARP